MSLMNDVLNELDRRGLREGDRTAPLGSTPGKRRRRLQWLPAAGLCGSLLGLTFVLGSDVLDRPDPSIPTSEATSEKSSAPHVSAGDEPDARPARASQAGLSRVQLEPLGSGGRLRFALDRAVVHRLDRIDETRVIIRFQETRLLDRALPVKLDDGPLAALHWLQDAGELRAVLDFTLPQEVETVMADLPGGAELIVHLRYPGSDTARIDHERDADHEGFEEPDLDAHLQTADSVVPASIAPDEDLAPGGLHTRLDAKPTLRMKSADSPAELAYREGRELDRLGRVVGALEKLSEALEHEPAHHRARERLARLMIREGDWSAAVRLLDEGRRLAPDHAPFVALEARVLVEGGFIGEAVELLESHTSSVEDDPDHFAFLAALLQRRGEHDRAAQLYASALQQKSEVASWWLGLAISLEAQEKVGSAHASYERAVAQGGLDEESRRYARERMRVIAGGVR